MSNQQRPSRLQLAFSAQALKTMSPAPVSPVSKNQPPIRSISQESTDAIRKRVCKACDRCRLKKSKCDGSSPCTRCKADNAICVFGERKKSHDKVYPKGYVEMLEQQQGQLVTALQDMYGRLVTAHAWEGSPLSQTNGHPLTHDILAALNLLESRQDGSGDLEVFEEDFSKLQSKLLADGAKYVHRRGSISSDSDHSQQLSPVNAKPPVFHDTFTFNSPTSSPVSKSPVTKAQRRFPPAHPSLLHQQQQCLVNEPQSYGAEWSTADLSESDAMMRSQLALQNPDMQEELCDFDLMLANTSFDNPSNYDANFGCLPNSPFPPQFSNPYGGTHGISDLTTGPDPMDVEFNKFVQVST